MNTTMPFVAQETTHPPSTGGVGRIDRWAIRAGTALIVWGRRRAAAGTERSRIAMLHLADSDRRNRELSRERAGLFSIGR